MHKFHRIKTFLVILSVIFLCSITAEAKNKGIENFGILVETESEDYEYKVNWWKSEQSQDNYYYLVLPYSVKNKQITLNYESNGAIFCDGKMLANGMEMPALEQGEHQLSCQDENYTLCVLYGSNIPVLHIGTDAGTMEEVYADKSHKEPGYAAIIQDGSIVYKGNLSYIKGRGNATWDYDKKPFNIKFEEKIDLFGMGKAKKWTLMANYLDDTLMKNKLACDFADLIGIDFSSKSMLVDLYIEGEYYGNYTLIESIEIGENRIDITDLEEANEQANATVEMDELKIGGVRGVDSYLEKGSYKWCELPTSPGAVNGGYLLEFELGERYNDEVSGFVSNYGQPVILKSPEYASKEQVNYIRSYYQEFEDAVLSKDGYNAQGKHYSEYVDIDSFAKMYVFQEYVKNLDAGLTSCYFYKDVNAKMVAGPVWDFDCALGRYKERNGVQMADPDGEWVSKGTLLGDLSEKKTIFALLCAHEDFRIQAKKQWEEYFEPNIDVFLQELELLYSTNRESMIADKCKWKNKGDYSATEEWFEKCVESLKSFVLDRSKFMTEMFMMENLPLNQEVVMNEKQTFIELIKNFLKRIIG